MRKIKILFTSVAALFIFSGVTLACPHNAQKIVDRIKAHPNVMAINITYSSDNKMWAENLQNEIIKLDTTLMVNLMQTTGTAVCAISRA